MLVVMLIDYLFPEYLQIMGKEVSSIEVLSCGIACLEL